MFQNSNNLENSLQTYPATDRHIEKARASEVELWEETPEIYEQVTKGFIDEQLKHLNWVRVLIELGFIS